MVYVTGFMLAFVVLLFVYTCLDKPLFRMRCKKCGKKDKNWVVVPAGHDDFGWQHECD